MKRLWPGWVLCALTLALLVYMAGVEAPAISARIGGLRLPDAVLLGYDAETAGMLRAAFAADLAAAEAQGRQSAAAAYVSLHAGSDLLFPPMLAVSLAFLAFAALNSRRNRAGAPRLARVGIGLTMVLAFVYLASDFVENAMADAMFGPQALNTPLNEQWVSALRIVTACKFFSVAAAFLVIVGLWFTRFRRPR